MAKANQTAQEVDRVKELEAEVEALKKQNAGLVFLLNKTKEKVAMLLGDLDAYYTAVVLQTAPAPPKKD